MSLDRTIKTKIDEIGTGTVAANDDKTITGKKVYTAIEGAKRELTNKINEKVSTVTFEEAKTELETKIAGKANKSLSDIDDVGKKVIKDLINVVGEDKIEVTSTNDNTSSVKKFTVKLNEDTKNKINSIGTGKVEVNNGDTVTGKAVYDAIKNSKVTVKANDNDSYITVNETKTNDITGDTFKIGLNLDALTTKLEETFSKKTDTFGLAGNDGVEVKKQLNNTIKIEGSESVESNKKKYLCI